MVAIKSSNPSITDFDEIKIQLMNTLLLSSSGCPVITRNGSDWASKETKASTCISQCWKTNVQTGNKVNACCVWVCQKMRLHASSLQQTHIHSLCMQVRVMLSSIPMYIRSCQILGSIDNNQQQQ